jgi:hypothetical protein
MQEPFGEQDARRKVSATHTDRKRNGWNANALSAKIESLPASALTAIEIWNGRFSSLCVNKGRLLLHIMSSILYLVGLARIYDSMPCILVKMCKKRPEETYPEQRLAPKILSEEGHSSSAGRYGGPSVVQTRFRRLAGFGDESSRFASIEVVKQAVDS